VWCDCSRVNEGLLLILLMSANIIESRGTQRRRFEVFNVLEWSQDNDHEKRVVNKTVLGKHLHVLLELADYLLSLRLCDLELFETLQEILILQGHVFEHLLLHDRNIELHYLSWIVEYLSVHAKGALDIEVEDHIIVLD